MRWHLGDGGIYDEHNRKVCSTKGSSTRFSIKQRRRNELLIALAPNLLEAAEEVLDRFPESRSLALLRLQEVVDGYTEDASRIDNGFA